MMDDGSSAEQYTTGDTAQPPQQDEAAHALPGSEQDDVAPGAAPELVVVTMLESQRDFSDVNLTPVLRKLAFGDLRQ